MRTTQPISNVTQTVIQWKGDNRVRNSSQRSKKKRLKKQRHFPFVSRPPELLTSHPPYLYLSLSQDLSKKSCFSSYSNNCPSLSALCIRRVREKLGERGKRAIVVQYSSLLLCPPVLTLEGHARPRTLRLRTRPAGLAGSAALLVSNNNVRACATAPKNKSFVWPQRTLDCICIVDVDVTHACCQPGAEQK